MKKWQIVCLVLVLGISCNSCIQDRHTPLAESGREQSEEEIIQDDIDYHIKVKDNYIELVVGHSFDLNDLILSSEYKSESFIWESENKFIAEITEGILYGCIIGETVLTVSNEVLGIYEEIPVEVIGKDIEWIEIFPDRPDYFPGDICNITVKSYPLDSKEAAVILESEDTSIIDKNKQGELVCLAPGIVTITATDQNGNKAYLAVEVNN